MFFAGYSDPISDRLFTNDKRGILFSFFYHSKGKIRTVLEESINSYGNRVMLDSGAFSWYTRNFGKTGGGVSGDFSFVESEKFKKFYKSYKDFLAELDLDNKISNYVGLDIIGNGEMSYHMWEDMYNSGFKRAIPVWHYGEEKSWLAKYMEDDRVTWIGLAEIVVAGSAKRAIREWNEVFDWLLKRYPKDLILRKKYHLFGQTGTQVLKVVPYDTADSVTYLVSAGMGETCLPIKNLSIKRYYNSNRKKGKNLFGLGNRVLLDVNRLDEDLFNRSLIEVFGSVIEFGDFEEQLIASNTIKTLFNLAVHTIVISEIERTISKEEKLDRIKVSHRLFT